MNNDRSNSPSKIPPSRLTGTLDLMPPWMAAEYASVLERRREQAEKRWAETDAKRRQDAQVEALRRAERLEAQRRETERPLGWPNPQFTLTGGAISYSSGSGTMSIPGSTAIWRDDPFAPKPPAPMPESRGRFSELDW